MLRCQGRARAQAARARCVGGCWGEVPLLLLRLPAPLFSSPPLSSLLQSSALHCQWTRRAAMSSSAWPRSSASSSPAATTQGGVPHLHGAGDGRDAEGGDRAASHICTAQVRGGMMRGGDRAASHICTVQVGSLSPCPSTARLPSLPSHRQAPQANTAAFYFPSHRQTARGRTAASSFPSHRQTARGRTAAFSFPSHRMMARGRTAAAARDAGRASVRWPRRHRRSGPLLRHRHGGGGGCGCSARYGGGARPQVAPHRRPHRRRLAGRGKRPVPSTCGWPQRHWQEAGLLPLLLMWRHALRRSSGVGAWGGGGGEAAGPAPLALSDEPPVFSLHQPLRLRDADDAAAAHALQHEPAAAASGRQGRLADY